MHLYTSPKAPNPQRLAFFMKYKGIEINTTEISIADGEQFSDEFVAINSASTLPVLVLDEGTILTDTISICIFLDRVFPEKSLFGSSDSEYAEVIGWDHRLYVEGLMAVAEIFRNQGDFFKDRAMPCKVNIPQLAVLIERGRLRLHAFWQILDERLANRQYIVGEQLTFADIDAYVICHFASWVKEKVPEDCQSIEAWRRRISEDLN